jgi:hypothetical protein
MRLSIAITILEKWVAGNMNLPPEDLLTMIKTRMIQAIEEFD